MLLVGRHPTEYVLDLMASPGSLLKVWAGLVFQYERLTQTFNHGFLTLHFKAADESIHSNAT